MRLVVYVKDKGPREDFDEVDMVFHDSERAAHYIEARLLHQWVVRVVLNPMPATGHGPTAEFDDDKLGVRGIRRKLDALGGSVEDL